MTVSPCDIWKDTDNLLNEKNVPFSIVLEVTRLCNLSCLHCYNIKDRSCLTSAQIGIIADQLRAAGCLFLTLTGGEIFTHPDILKIIKLFKDRGFDLKLISNGTLITERIVQYLCEYPPSEIGISILGATAQTHDGITGRAGSFDGAMETMRLLKRYQLPVHLKCTLMQENLHEYPKIIQLSERLKITHIIDPIISPCDDGSREVLLHRLSDADLRSVYQQEFQKTVDFSSTADGFPCEAGKTFGAISSQGDVYPCIQLPYKIGNVFRKSLKNIWNESPLLKKIRSADCQDTGKCRDCKLRPSCTKCPGLAFVEDGDIFGPSSVACMIAEMSAQFIEQKKYSHETSAKK